MEGTLLSCNPYTAQTRMSNMVFTDQLLEEAHDIETAPDLKKIPVVEIFGPTIQGEGIVIGQRTVFIRFGLCDYKCVKCDSMHAVDPVSVKKLATWMTQGEIFARVMEVLVLNNCRWVTFSGGNPAIHDLTELCNSLSDVGIGMAVETQGTFAPEWLNRVDYITVSPKGPGMGEKFEVDKMQAFMAAFLWHRGLSIKVVIFDARDYEFASMIAEMYPQVVNSDRFYLSLGNPFPPELGGATTKSIPIQVRGGLAASMQRYTHMLDEIKQYKSLATARILPQLHFWLWGDERGR